MLGTSNININLLQRRQWQPTPVFLPGESQGWGSLLGCRLLGRTGLDATEVTSQQQQQHLSTSSPMPFQAPTMCKVQHGATEMMSVHKPRERRCKQGPWRHTDRRTQRREKRSLWRSGTRALHKELTDRQRQSWKPHPWCAVHLLSDGPVPPTRSNC